MSSQEPILHWARDHRVHHKFTDTDADPYNSRRGFFFSHIGWLMCKKHPDVLEQGKKVDMSDLESDPLLQFQKKYFIPLMLLLNFSTIGLACYLGESFNAAWNGNLFKFVILLNTTWSVSIKRLRNSTTIIFYNIIKRLLMNLVTRFISLLFNLRSTLWLTCGVVSLMTKTYRQQTLGTSDYGRLEKVRE